jgi:hypothetical protein
VDVGLSAARIRAVKALRGPLPVRTLETFRSAGRLVYRELDDADRLRRELLGARMAARRFPPAAAGRLLSVWNAFVLQTMGEHLLDAVRYSPGGVVRSAEADQILAFFGQVDRWLSQARQAAIDPAYRVEEHVDVPAEPPAWLGGDSRPHPLTAAMVAAARVIHARGRATLADYAHSLGAQSADLHRLGEVLDRAADAIGYAARPPRDVGGLPLPASDIPRLRYALRMLYLFGQLTAMPNLLDVPDRTRVASLVAQVPVKIDPWCLTDPYQRTTWQLLASARIAIEKMWATDTCPMATVRVQAQIHAALRNGAVIFAADRAGERLGSFYRCPWPAIYEVRKPVTIGGTKLLPIQHFTYDVVGEAHVDREPFARRIVVSLFASADPVVSGGTAGRHQN